MTPEEFRQLFIKSRGLNLDSNPLTVAPPTPVRTVPIVPADQAPQPNPVGAAAWRTGVDQDIRSGVVSPPNAPPVTPMPVAPVVPPRPFPVAAAPAVPYTNPAIQGGPAGLTLNTNPTALGWAGSVGLPGTPAEATAFDKGQKWNELASAAGDAIKAFQNKPSDAASAAAATITPMSVQPNQPNSLSFDLMAQLLQGRRNRGLTLTGR